MAVRFCKRPTFTLSVEDEIALAEAAKQRGISRSKLVRELIRANLSTQKSLGAA
jgi:L-amino acid N-acyltransferase YncA